MALDGTGDMVGSAYVEELNDDCCNAATAAKLTQ